MVTETNPPDESHDETSDTKDETQEAPPFDWENFTSEQGKLVAELANARATEEQRGQVQAAIANARQIHEQLLALLPAPPSA